MDQLLKEGAFGLASKILTLIPKQATRSFFSATANEVLKEIQELAFETPQVIDVTEEDQSKG